MKIAINTRFLLPNRLEGLGWYTHEIARRLVERHPEHEYLFVFDRPFDPAFVYSDRVTPISVFPPARHPFLFYLWFEHAVPRALKNWGADVFFSPDNFLSLSTPVPTLLTLHDVISLQMPEQVKWVNRQYYQLYQRRFAQRANHIVTVSEYTKQSIIETCQVPSDNISVAYNGYRDIFTAQTDDIQAITRQQFSDGQPYFFYSGAIHPRKNIPGLIRAFDHFKSRTGAPVKLLLGGRFAWQTGEVLSAYQASPFQNDIKILGYVADEDLPRLMSSALALVYISISEGFGLPVLEAMACDVPVLCSNTTALPEVAGDATLLVNPIDEGQIVAGMINLCEKPSLRASLIEKGQLQRQKFSWDLAADRVMELLQGVSR